MMSWHVVVVSVTAVGLACLLMLAVVVVTKIGRTSRRTRRQARLAPYRRDLLAVSSGEDDGSSAAALCAATGTAGEMVDLAAVDMLGKIRGAPADALVGVLLRHGAIRSAMRGLDHRSPVQRAKAAQMLGLSREVSAVPALVGALEDGAVEVRTAAGYALGLIGDPAAAGPVLAAVGAPGAGLPAGIAADALLGMGVQIHTALVEAMSDPDPRPRHVAAYVSGVGAFTRTVPMLRSLLAQDEDLTVREAAAEALAAIGGRGDVEVLARHTAADQPLPLRRGCATALGQLGDPAANATLQGLLDDPDPRLAELAASALLSLSPAAGSGLVERAEAEPRDDAQRGRPIGAAVTIARLQGVLR